MSRTLCRLCLSGERLINVFDARLANSRQLRMCIVLCTGVEIKEDDTISKMTCHCCCTVALKFFKYRQTALANDKALKAQIEQPNMIEVQTEEDILALHKSILENISHVRVDESLAKFYNSIETEKSTDTANSEAGKRVDSDTMTDVTLDSDIHSTEHTFQYFPTVIVPNSILTSEVDTSTTGEGDLVAEVPREVEQQNSDDAKHESEESDQRKSKFAVDVAKLPENDKCAATDTAVEEVCKQESDEAASKQEASTQTDFPDQIEATKQLDHTDCNTSVTVFKSRKRRYSSDDSFSDCDSEVGEEYANSKRNETCKTRSSKNKIPKINYQSFVESDPEDLDIISDMQRNPGMPRNCQYCDKVCYGKTQLNKHEIGTHRKCIVCGKIFKTPEALEIHLRNVCYKQVEYNQPYLELPRIDEEADVVKLYQEAFDYYHQAVEEGIYAKDESEVAVKPIQRVDKNFPLYHTEEYIKVENEFIASVFNKFKDVQNEVVMRNKRMQTRRPEPAVRYGNQNQITIQNMYDDVLMYKVPIQMVINKKMYAHISFTTKPEIKKTFDNWSDAKPIDVVIRSEKLNACLRAPEVKFCLEKVVVANTYPVPTATTKSITTKLPMNKAINKPVANRVDKPIQQGRIVKIIPTSTNNPRPKFFNIARILTSVAPPPLSQANTVPKTVLNVTYNPPQTNCALKEETPDVDDDASKQNTATNAKSSATFSPITPNIVFKSEEPPSQNVIPTDGGANKTAPYQQNIIFRFPINSGIQHQQVVQNNALYQKHANTNPTPRPNVYMTQPRRANAVQNKIQYSMPSNTYKPNYNNSNNLLLTNRSPQLSNIDNDIKPNINQLGPNVNIMLPNNVNHLSNISANAPLILNNINQLPTNRAQHQGNMNHHNMPTSMNHVQANHNHVSSNVNHVSPNMNHIQANLNHIPNNMGHVPGNMNHVPGRDSYASTNMNHLPTNMNRVPTNMNHAPANMNQISGGMNMNHIPGNMSHITTNLNHMSASSMSHVSNNMNHQVQPNHSHLNSMYLNSMSPINSVPSPINSVPSPINSATSPITSAPSPINSAPSSINSYTNSYNNSYNNTYNNSYADSYSAPPYDMPPQYIPPYNTNHITDYDPYSETNPNQMLQPMNNVSDTKSFIRVKQPWELNQV